MKKKRTTRKPAEQEVLRGIAIGDLHLDKLVKMIPNINNIVIGYCRNLLQQAVDDGYDIAVFLGDIFNYMTASPDAERLLLELFVEFQDSIAIRAIEGNHGYRRNGTGSLSTLSMLEEFKLLRTMLVTKPRCEVIKGVPLLYLPHPYTCVQDVVNDTASLHSCLVDSGLLTNEQYDQADSLGADVEGLLYETIAFGHFTRAGSITDNGMTTDSGIKYDKNFDAKYYIVGHLHTPQTVGKTTFYPGTFYQTSFGEGQEKGYGKFIATMDGDKIKFKYQQVEVDPPIKLVNIVASTEDHLPELPNHTSRTWYKVSCVDGFELPDEYRKSRHIVEATPSVTMSKNNKVTETLSVGFNLEDSLIEYLQRDGLSDKEIQAALKMTNKALGVLGIEL